MTSVGTSRARGSWEQTQTQNQAQHKQRPQVRAKREASLETGWLVVGRSPGLLWFTFSGLTNSLASPKSSLSPWRQREEAGRTGHTLPCLLSASCIPRR